VSRARAALRELLDGHSRPDGVPQLRRVI